MAQPKTPADGPGRQPPEAERSRLVLESVVEQATAGLAVLRAPDFVYELANPAYRALSPFREMMGRRFAEVWPEATQAILPVFEKVIETGERYASTDMRVDIQRAREGPLEESYFSFACMRLADAPGERPALLVTVLDTTALVLARREAEARTRERERLLDAERLARQEAERSGARFQLLSAAAAELSAGLDLEAVFETTLSRGARLLGADDGSLFLLEPDGASIRGFSELQASARAGATLALGSIPHSREAVESGRPVHFSLGESLGEETAWFHRLGIRSALVLPLKEGDRCLGLLYFNWRGRDASPSEEDLGFGQALASQCALAIGRARVHQAEKAARTAAESVSQLQEQLIAILGHDLRTPLGAIAMAVSLLFQRGGLNERQATALERIASSAARMRGMIDDLLDFSRARQGNGIPLERRRAHIDAICAAAVRELQDAHPSRRIEVSLAGDGEGDWDPNRLEQVVSNLVHNALHHSPEWATVQVRADGRADEIVLEVHNEGSVIPDEAVKSIFEPYRQGDRGEGLGLGLFIVKEIVEGHGGSVEVRSSQLEGTVFAVRLPRSAGAGASVFHI